MYKITDLNKIGGIINRLKDKFKYDEISEIKRAKNFYNLYIDTSIIIRALENPENQNNYCYNFSYEIQYDYRDFVCSDYLYLKAQLTADLSAELNVYVNCNINSLCRIIDGTEIYYLRIETFIRKPPKKE